MKFKVLFLGLLPRRDCKFYEVSKVSIFKLIHTNFSVILSPFQVTFSKRRLRVLAEVPPSTRLCPDRDRHSNSNYREKKPLTETYENGYYLLVFPILLFLNQDAKVGFLAGANDSAVQNTNFAAIRTYFSQMARVLLLQLSSIS